MLAGGGLLAHSSLSYASGKRSNALAGNLNILPRGWRHMSGNPTDQPSDRKQAGFSISQNTHSGASRRSCFCNMRVNRAQLAP
jgi:hypothetical protein